MISRVIFSTIIVLVAMVILTIRAESNGQLFNTYHGQSFIWVVINKNKSIGKLHFVDEKGHIKYSTWISSGAKGYRTPAGNYKIYYKKRYHMSTKYPETNGINNMNYSLFFLNGFALHQGNPRQSSHGCVHVVPNVASKLYNDARHGTPVIITKVAAKKIIKQKKRRLFQTEINYIIEGF